MATTMADEKSTFSNGCTRAQSTADTEANDLDIAKTKSTIVEGTTRLYANGKLRCIPMPTANPKDPLNLPPWRKFMAVFALCFYGSIALSAQQILGSLLPVFVFEYAGLDPNLVTGGGEAPSTGAPSGSGSGIPAGVPVAGSAAVSARSDSFSSIMSGDLSASPTTGLTMPSSSAAASKIDPNPLATLANIPNAPPLWRVNLLSSLPILLVGLSNYFLVPLSIVIGRRPVVLTCSLLSWVCCIWAGKSGSLNDHLAARSIQAIGAGAVESLVPFIVQDMSFIHQRNRAIGVIWASQGIVTLALGIGSTYIVARMGWRWLYFILAIFGALSWLMLIAFVPETRWQRTQEELRGESAECPPGEVRPPLDYEKYGPRTWRTNLAFSQGGVHFDRGLTAFKEILTSLIFPNVMIIVLLNGAFIGISLATSQTSSPVLLAAPYNWKFSSIGYSVLGIVIASIFVYAIGSEGSDRLSNYLTKRRGGKREPEVHLYSLIFPLFTGILGCVLFGIGGSYSDKVHWVTLLLGASFLNFAFLTINIVGGVYCIECFPSWAGPVLVNAASLRNLIGFGISFGITDWITARGYMGSYGIFAGLITLLSFGVPILFVYGKKWRLKSGKRWVSKTGHSD